MKRLLSAQAILSAFVLAGCREPVQHESHPSALKPHGSGAHVIAREMWVQFGVAAFTFSLVIGLLIWILVVRSRRDATAEEVRDERRPQRWLVLGGIVFPVLTLTVLFGWSVHDLVALNDPPDKGSVVVEVVGHRWWWDVEYPNEGIATANHIVLPVGESVRFRIRSADVIHSFWVPALGRKLDGFPNEWTTMWLHVGDPGRYRGLCAEFCGLQHAHMDLIVDAVTPAKFATWLALAKEKARKPTTESQRRGLQIFESQTCAYCHTIRGTRAAGWAGPDLTHLASRPALAGATLPNTRGNLGGWISDPQHVKPGALMPPAQLTGSQLQALLDYLTSLK
jgi:cytochrome c oxidase subunit 2